MCNCSSWQSITFRSNHNSFQLRSISTTAVGRIKKKCTRIFFSFPAVPGQEWLIEFPEFLYLFPYCLLGFQKTGKQILRGKKLLCGTKPEGYFARKPSQKVKFVRKVPTRFQTNSPTNSTKVRNKLQNLDNSCIEKYQINDYFNIKCKTNQFASKKVRFLEKCHANTTTKRR